jgi:NADH:ubiquinone oxidoreductase subunit D
MKNTYNLLKQGTVAFMSIIAIDGYRRAVIRDNKMRESDRLLQYTLKKYESAVKQVEEKQDLIASNETEVVASLGKIKQDLEILNQDTHNLANQVSTNNNQGIETSSKVINKSATSVVDEINKLIDKINRPGSNNSLNNIFDFSSYTTAELGAISHMLAFLFLVVCLILLLLIMEII